MLNVRQLKDLLDPLPDDFKIMFETARSEDVEVSVFARCTGIWTEATDERVVIVGVPREPQVPGRVRVYSSVEKPTKACPNCGRGVPLDEARFNCCPEHTTEDSESAICTECAKKFHPEVFGNG